MLQHLPLFSTAKPSDKICPIDLMGAHIFLKFKLSYFRVLGGKPRFADPPVRKKHFVVVRRLNKLKELQFCTRCIVLVTSQFLALSIALHFELLL
ncbi:hypothetical protein SUGI_0645250 [Cryptomeria japonica]|nr:hypothetical protein SUGI_0645250 [Cryptomeria japonica]